MSLATEPCRSICFRSTEMKPKSKTHFENLDRLRHEPISIQAVARKVLRESKDLGSVT